MVCSFFGHRDVPKSVYTTLVSVIEDLIEKHGDIRFMVGHQGSFDSMVLKALRACKKNHPELRYEVVLAYLPGARDEYENYESSETVLARGIENTPKRYAIVHRNRWMIKESEIVVCYITRSWGGAAQFVEYARRQKKQIINLA